MIAALLGQVVLFVVTGWIVGDLVLRAIKARVDHDAKLNLGTPERALFAVMGFVAFAGALMVVNIVTRGLVFGSTLSVPLAGAAVLIVGWRTRPWPRGLPWRGVGAAILVLGALYVAPVLISGPGSRTGDIPFHLGWTQQLLAGEPVPAGPAPGVGNSAYPWGFHAVLATQVRLLPGSDPLIALEALHVLLVVAIPLSAACLARQLRSEAGWAGAAAAALIGGLGWMAARAPHFNTSPSNGEYGADLVVASPNSVYELLPPALPRELGLVLLAAFGVLIGLGTSTGDRVIHYAAGVALGLVGLISVPLFMSGVSWTVAAVIVTPGKRPRAAARIFVPAFCVLALWGGPVAVDYIRYGGFVDITPRLGHEWPLPTALGAWGLLLPAALAGGVIALQNSGRHSVRTLLAFAAGTVVVLLLSIARAELDWNVAGNPTLLHQGRVWPVAHLLGAAFGGLALMSLYSLLRSRSEGLAALATAAVLMVGAASPILASVRLTQVLESHSSGYLYGREDLSPGSFARRASDHLGPDDIVEVEGSDELAFTLFSFSGARLASYDDERLEGNDLRIRYADLARQWNERAANGGFDPDYVVVPEDRAEGQALVEGTYEGRRWSLLRS